MRRISAATKNELIKAINGRYAEASRREKTRILDELVAITGHHRKHVIQLVRYPGRVAAPRAKRPMVYDDAAREALVVLWEASDRICSKRLKAILPQLLISLESHGHLRLEITVRGKVLAMSASTMDGLLRPIRAVSTPRRPARAAPAVRKDVPVWTHADWKEPPPGYMEVDLVAHSGGNTAGSFVQTLVLTDIASGWTECIPILTKDGALLAHALEQLRRRMPFPLPAIVQASG